MRNTGVCHVELRGSRAYLSVAYYNGTTWLPKLVRIHFCPFCAKPLGKRKVRKLRKTGTKSLHSRPLSK